MRVGRVRVTARCELTFLAAKVRVGSVVSGLRAPKPLARAPTLGLRWLAVSASECRLVAVGGPCATVTLTGRVHSFYQVLFRRVVRCAGVSGRCLVLCPRNPALLNLS